MVSRKTVGAVSGIAVSGMLMVAWSEFDHGKPAGEVHLITAAPLTIGSSIVFTGAGYHQNTIIEAEYRAPPDTTPLPNDGMIQPSSAPTLTGVTLFSSALGPIPVSTTSTF